MMNGYDAYCLIIEEDNNNIFGNIFTDNFYGIRMQETAANNLIYNNNFTMNTFGLVVCGAGYNEITNNIFTDNDIGINLESGSFENIIYHNYFINNLFKSFDYTDCKNQWNNSYPSGGNFWDDYTGVDNYKGPNQNEPGSDGIGDTPYTIQGLYACEDGYPLMGTPGPNNPPNTPFNPTPKSGTTNTNINHDLYWSGGDPDSGDTVTYDVYFGTASNPPLVKSSHASTSYEPSIMSYNTKYYWKIIAKDNHGLTSVGPIWNFTTQAQSSGGGGSGGGGGDILLPNKVPIANASASQKNGFVNTPITFDGSYSTDEDGEITNYTWDFGDNSYANGILTTHIYKKVDVYNVKLTVTDNNNVNDTDSFKVVISQANNQPTATQINGPKTGKQNIEYDYTVFSTDPDNDKIQYVFNWGDDKTNETEFLTNGTIYVQKHKWTSPGVYKIKVFAVDSNYAVSTSTEIYILIDVIYCQNLGYLIDEDSDGTYTLFYSNQTKAKTSAEKQQDGSYLINNDADSDWDYSYNFQTGILKSYSSKTPSGEQAADNTVGYAILAVLVIIIVLLLIFITKRKK
jgi:parallel beta-helix repeat protein